MVTRIWHGVTPAAKSDEYLNLMRTVAIPDYRSTPGNKGAYALRRLEGDTAHFLVITFWESEEAIRAFAGDDITWRNTMTSTRTSCSNWSRAPRITRCTTGKPIRLWLRRCPLSARS
jgi:heme-degrading monooxygenase HmoA